MYNKLWIGIFLAILSFSLYAAKNKAVRTVNSVELDRYLGTWYEIASIPNRFEAKCVANSKSEYSLVEMDLIKVINSCDTQNGTYSIEGRGKIKDKKTNAKFGVTFTNFISWVYLFEGNYWVLDVADDYSYAVVGEPGRRYAWILSRSESLSDHLLERAYRVLNKNSYDTCLVFTSVQSHGIQERKPLCDIFD